MKAVLYTAGYRRPLPVSESTVSSPWGWPYSCGALDRVKAASYARRAAALAMEDKEAHISGSL